MSDLKPLALKLATQGPHQTLQTPKQIRILFNGTYIANTTSALYVWEHPFYPWYYIPYSCLDAAHLTTVEDIKTEDGETMATILSLQVGDKKIEDILSFSQNLSGAAQALAGLVKIPFASAEQWFEESVPIYVHPKDPFKRIEILHSSRPLKISIAGHVVAETTSSWHLYETMLPCRYYIPLPQVDVSVLRASGTRTKCPYKGEAEYYSIDLGRGEAEGEGGMWEDVVWYYTNPTVESSLIGGLVCFYNEKVDIELDGVKLERPETLFGKHKPSEKKMPSMI